MSSYDESGQNETCSKSPSDIHSSKRRRVALACLDCRRRKLKCDRVYPACSRCQKGGHASSCTYDAGAVESIFADGSHQKTRFNQDPESLAKSKTVASPISFVHHHALDTDESALAGLRAHVNRLENRIIGLEKAAHAPQKHSTLPRLNDCSEHLTVGHALNSVRQEENETIMFRGKSFKTQFYGASHHTSYLSQV